LKTHSYFSFQAHTRPVYRTTSKESPPAASLFIQLKCLLHCSASVCHYPTYGDICTTSSASNKPADVLLTAFIRQRRVPIPRKERRFLAITIPCNCRNIFSLLQELPLIDWNQIQRSRLIHLDLLRPGRVSHRTYSCKLCPGLQGYIR
jgi:hypothetical protein